MKTIIEWHEQTFPDATLEGQLTKFDDEVREFFECELQSEEAATELADCFIVACGIARFSATDAVGAFSFVDSYVAHEIKFKQMFENAIQDKMAINKSRTWSIGKGNYQHIGE
ncbi:MAG: hypothetical protein J6R99_01885 [Alphaproteobacteria bacterium]|nr:hypothetical protein [Alphaproteobacteria bacterium]